MAHLTKMTAQDLSDAIDVLIAARYSFDLCALAADCSASSSREFYLWAEHQRDLLETQLGAIADEYLSRKLEGSDVQQRVYGLARAFAFIARPNYAPPAIAGVGCGL